MTDQNKISLIIVEAYQLFRTDMLCVLQKNYNVLGNFASAENCLKSMKHQIPDVIILDLSLPEMNGIEAIRLIKLHFPKVKIIVYTSHEDKKVAMAAMSYGASAYISKDTHLNSLVYIVNAVNEGMTLFDSRVSEIAYSFLPKPHSTDFDNLYPNESTKINITCREMEVLHEVARGKSNPEIAETLVVSRNTIKAHVSNVMKKLKAVNRIQAVDIARKKGIIKD